MCNGHRWSHHKKCMGFELTNHKGDSNQISPIINHMSTCVKSPSRIQIGHGFMALRYHHKKPKMPIFHETLRDSHHQLDRIWSTSVFWHSTNEYIHWSETKTFLELQIHILIRRPPKTHTLSINSLNWLRSNPYERDSTSPRGNFPWVPPRTNPLEELGTQRAPLMAQEIPNWYQMSTNTSAREP